MPCGTTPNPRRRLRKSKVALHSGKCECDRLALLEQYPRAGDYTETAVRSESDAPDAQRDRKALGARMACPSYTECHTYLEQCSI
jgi:hypothetical protein